jgi:urease accessory protein
VRPISDGLLDLRLSAGQDGKTRIVARNQRFPLTTTVPMYLDPHDRGMAFLYVQNPTGGMFAGDRLTTRIDVGEGCRVHLTTPSATKVFRTEDEPASQRIEISVGPDAYVEYVPEPLIPHEGARLNQALEVRLGPRAGFVATEVITPGRFARGEKFKYRELLLTTVIRDSAGCELCVDTTSLEPPRHAPDSRGLLGGQPFLGSVIAAAPDRDAVLLSEGLVAASAALHPAAAAAGELPSGAGAYARILASSAPAIRTCVDHLWSTARTLTLGHEAPRPRK